MLPVVAAVVVVLGAVGAFALFRLRDTPEATATPPPSEASVELVSARDDRPRDQGVDRPPMTIRLQRRASPPGPPPGPPPSAAPPMDRRIAPRRLQPPPPPSADKDEREALAARARMNRMYARAAMQSSHKQVQIVMYMTSW